MNIPVHEDRTTLSFEAPTSKQGQYVCLRAEMDLVIAFSACPQVSEEFLHLHTPKLPLTYPSAHRLTRLEKRIQ